MNTDFTIEALTAELMDEATEIRMQSWIDTYVNDDAGVSLEWIEERNRRQRSEEYRQKRLARLTNPHWRGWVAMHGSKVVGVVTPYVDEAGRQHVGSLYVDKTWHGKGVGAALLQKVFNWADPAKPIELGVVTYNHRAIAFYKKHGFEAVPDSEMLFGDVVPEFRMVRPVQI